MMNCIACGKPVEKSGKDWLIRVLKEDGDGLYLGENDIDICMTCAEEQAIAIRSSKYEPFMEAFSRMANSSIFNYDGTEAKALAKLFSKEHRHLQCQMIEFLIMVLGQIGSHAGDPQWIDFRNEWALAWAKKAAALT